jgi:hypothetical protein
LQQLKAEPYHLADAIVDGAMATLVELFARTCQQVTDFSHRCKQLMYRSRTKLPQQRRGRSSRNSVWTDTTLSVTLVEDRKSRSTTRSAIRLVWSDKQYPELGQESVELWQDFYEGLLRTHAAHGHAPELARARIFAMVLRHETLAEAKLSTPLGLPPAAFDMLGSRFATAHECFASPLNNTLPSFCSLFPDTDIFFGSRGNFFDFEPSVGCFVVHTSPDSQIMQDACDHIVHLLTSSEQALCFCLVMPAERRVPITDLVETKHASLIRECTELPRGQHCYLSGCQHRLEGKGEHQGRAVEKGESHLYWLQNDLGAATWYISSDTTANLVDAFREQPSGITTASTVTGDLPTPQVARHKVSEGQANGSKQQVAAARDASKPFGTAVRTGRPPAAVTAAKNQRDCPVQASSGGDDLRGNGGENQPQGRGIEELMESMGTSSLTVDLAAQVVGQSANYSFVPDRQLLAWLDALGLAKYSPCVLVAMPRCIASHLVWPISHQCVLLNRFARACVRVRGAVSLSRLKLIWRLRA